MSKQPTLRQFQDRFPTEEACLEHLKQVRFGARHDCAKCGKSAVFYRVKARRAYACEHCGAQVYPTAGTPFDRTRTSLRDWFHVMFLFVTSRNGVAAKEVERQIGVTYKTAWRMCHEIRKYMGEVDGDGPIGGLFRTVEVDEAYLGGKTDKAIYLSNKTLVLAMLERGGNIVTRIVPNRRGSSLLPVVKATVRRASEIHTDELTAYTPLNLHGFEHKTVNHKRGQYVAKGGVTVNGLEGFWSALKRGINGTYVHVSQKHLPKYLAEFEFRHNLRKAPHLMLDQLLLGFAR